MSKNQRKKLRKITEENLERKETQRRNKERFFEEDKVLDEEMRDDDYFNKPEPKYPKNVNSKHIKKSKSGYYDSNSQAEIFGETSSNLSKKFKTLSFNQESPPLKSNTAHLIGIFAF